MRKNNNVQAVMIKFTKNMVFISLTCAMNRLIQKKSYFLKKII